jgi:hypothetical protein
VTTKDRVLLACVHLCNAVFALTGDDTRGAEAFVKMFSSAQEAKGGPWRARVVPGPEGTPQIEVYDIIEQGPPSLVEA